MAPTIEGGSVEHRELLRSILDRFGRTGIERLELGRQMIDFTRNDGGVSLKLVSPAERTQRVRWEVFLVAAALRAAADDAGLEEVVWVEAAGSGHNLRWTPRPKPALSGADVERLRSEVEAAALAANADVEALELLRPSGHAFALWLRVAEPHSFMRLRYTEFDAATTVWRERCGNQVYLEVRDQHEAPVLLSAAYGNGGSGGIRPDVECCSPFPIRGGMFRGLVPRCPVFT